MREISFKNLKSILQENLISQTNQQVTKTVSAIIEDVRKNRDKALLKYIKKFENKNATLSNLVIKPKSLKEAYNGITKNQREALNLAYDRINFYHNHQAKKNFKFKDKLDTTFSIKWNPIETVGLYIPGGLASYPSTVLMTSVPARIAGVKNIMISVPSSDGKVSKLTLAAAHLCKVNKVYNMGGAQAIAAFAYGTKTIQKAHKVFGPGNQFVAEAKKQLFGTIGIDLPAGPSEILVLADNFSKPNLIASDILAQAEHDPHAKTYLVCTCKNIIKKVIQNIQKIQKEHKFKNADASLKNFSYAILAKNLSKMIEISNFIAPEHLHVHIKDTSQIEQNIVNAGSVFIGEQNAVALGDYSIGTNHVLPTDQSAKYSSGLSLDDFVKKTVFVRVGKKTFSKIADKTIELAKSEGLDAHALSIELRVSKS
ncbi:histidinol dehydrogenase [Alphaproteobacteria bacterium]|nr:histidinol dehydrogenase [Alphaproteobacteria bacterium]